jgi:pyrrolidone-carboxylate peptidase
MPCCFFEPSALVSPTLAPGITTHNSFSRQAVKRTDVERGEPLHEPRQPAACYKEPRRLWPYTLLLPAESRMSATFLITGFEPFREHVTNASWDALQLLEADLPLGVVTRCLPVDQWRAHTALRQLLLEHEPLGVLCTGLAPGRVFRIERRARRPVELEQVQGADELFGRWPWQEMAAALTAVRVPSVDSLDAGQYVCESTYWSLLSLGQEQARDAGNGWRAPAFAGFLHVPPAGEVVPLHRIAEAIRRVVTVRYTRALESEAGA